MEKMKKTKEGKNESQHLNCLSQNILGHSQGVYKILKTLALIGVEISVIENLIGQKEENDTYRE